MFAVVRPDGRVNAVADGEQGDDGVLSRQLGQESGVFRRRRRRSADTRRRGGQRAARLRPSAYPEFPLATDQVRSMSLINDDSIMERLNFSPFLGPKVGKLHEASCVVRFLTPQGGDYSSRRSLT